MRRQICQKWGWEWLLFMLAKIPIGRLDANAIQQNVVTSNLFFCWKSAVRTWHQTACVNSLLFLNSNMWHFVCMLETIWYWQYEILGWDFVAKTAECLHFEHLSSFDYSLIKSFISQAGIGVGGNGNVASHSRISLVYIFTAVSLGCVASRPVIGWRLCPTNSAHVTDECGVGHRDIHCTRMTAVVFQPQHRSLLITLLSPRHTSLSDEPNTSPASSRHGAKRRGGLCIVNVDHWHQVRWAHTNGISIGSAVLAPITVVSNTQT